MGSRSAASASSSTGTETSRHEGADAAWVRVNQPAGAGEGAVYHPRVGDEVVVEFLEGDPDCPLVTGRVYNGAHLPPRTRGEHSTLKSFSTPGGAVYNELTFEDQAGGELWHQNAGKDHNLDVGNCRLETVAVDAVMAVGADNAEKIGAECMVTVGANHTLTVGANQTITVAANSTTTIGGNSNHTTSANKSQTIGANETMTIGATLTETVSGSVTETYGATKSTTVAASFSETFSATETITVSGNVTVSSGATHDLTVNGPRLILVGGNLSETVAGATTHDFNSVELRLFGGEQAITAPSITKNCPIHSSSTRRRSRRLWPQIRGQGFEPQPHGDEPGRDRRVRRRLRAQPSEEGRERERLRSAREGERAEDRSDRVEADDLPDLYVPPRRRDRSVTGRPCTKDQP